jgi:hypothetical protein
MDIVSWDFKCFLVHQTSISLHFLSLILKVEQRQLKYGGDIISLNYIFQNQKIHNFISDHNRTFPTNAFSNSLKNNYITSLTKLYADDTKILPF